MNNSIKGFLIFIVGVFLGWCLVVPSWNYQSSVERDPAAIRSQYDLSALQGESRWQAMKKRILSGYRVENVQDEQWISLGHFLFMNSLGQSKFACEEYNQIVISFIGEGTAVSGEPAQMSILSPCQFSNNVSIMDPIKLPVQKILESSVGEGDFDFRENNNVTVSFKNVNDVWPKHWVLKSIELKNSADILAISSEDLKKTFSEPLVLKW